jgi:hypothetical protein
MSAAAVLDRLEGRWGPSDSDRDAWLGFRRGGLTATDIRDLYTGSKTISVLVAEKLGRRSVSFGGNRYTAWGSEREPIIAATIAERYAIAHESRALRDATDPRRLASVDGVGPFGLDGDLCIDEIKTSGAPIAYLSPAFEAKGYLAQIVWGMARAGAVACLYAWELRHEDGAGWFVPGDLTCEWILLADHLDLLAELEALGDRFFAAYDAAASEPWVEPQIDEDLDTLAVNILAARITEGEGKAAKEAAWSSLQDRLRERGTDFQQESVLARITYTAATETPSTERVVNHDEAIVQAPELYDELDRARAALAAVEARWVEHLKQFTTENPVTTTTKANLTVTAVKPKDIKP